jgi:mono/diheme cytochrome c family protein
MTHKEAEDGIMGWETMGKLPFDWSRGTLATAYLLIAARENKPQPSAILSIEASAAPPLAVVCAWHGTESKAEADQWAISRGYSLSHGICLECAKKYEVPAVVFTD